MSSNLSAIRETTPNLKLLSLASSYKYAAVTNDGVEVRVVIFPPFAST